MSSQFLAVRPSAFPSNHHLSFMAAFGLLSSAVRPVAGRTGPERLAEKCSLAEFVFHAD